MNIETAIGIGTGIIGSSIVLSTLIKSLINKSKLQKITQSGWMRVTNELEKVREDTDKHEQRILTIEVLQNVIMDELKKFGGFIDELRSHRDFPCPHHPLKKSPPPGSGPE